MPDYGKTKIYYIQVLGKRYYGATTSSLRARKNGHKGDAKRHPQVRLYQEIKESNVSWDEIELVLVENYPCETLKQSKDRERYWIEQFGELNCTTPNKSPKEYRNEHRERIRLRKKKFRDDNREMFQERWKAFYAENKEKEAQRKAKFYQENKQKFAEHYLKNKDAINEKKKKARLLKKNEAHA